VIGRFAGITALTRRVFGASHRIWRWRADDCTDEIYEENGSGETFFSFF
jgi:hypothetical protein